MSTSLFRVQRFRVKRFKGLILSFTLKKNNYRFFPFQEPATVKPTFFSLQPSMFTVRLDARFCIDDKRCVDFRIYDET